MNWYYAVEGRQAGPISEADWDGLIRAGTIAPETLVWHEGMADWQPFQVVQSPAASPPVDSQEAVAAPVGAVCSECGQPFPAEEIIHYGTAAVCARCKPVFVQKLREGATLQGCLEYAGFWTRVAAKMVDGLIVGVPLMLLYLLWILPSLRSNRSLPLSMQLLVQIGFYAVGAAYSTFFLGKYGATPGKMACKIQVITAEGGRVTYARAFGRYFAEILSGLICYIGYLMVAFDGEKRALHDRICNTRVVKK
ncbi:MAG: RDD family protein [Verrucomicrobiota bacterium]